jgi:MFS family permease
MAIDAEEAVIAPLSMDGQSDQTAPGAWAWVIMLILIGVFSQLDGRAFGLLIQAIKHDLHLSDTAIGLLTGFNVSIAYLVVGLALSRYVDRSNRKVIIAIGLGVWSAAVSLCGLAQNVVQLVLARVLQGAGGSLNGPATFSLLADLFPRDRLPRAIAWTNLGGVIGSIGLLALGAILLLIMHVHPMHVGGLVIHNWQVVFIAVGLPGVILAPIVYLSMPEPTRRGLETAAQRKVPLIDVLKHLFGQWRLYAPMFVGLGLSSISNGGRGAWDAPFFFRTYHWSAARFALTNGLIDIPASLLGLALGVLLVERFARQGRADAPLRVVVISRLISVPVLMAMPLMPNPWLATAMLAIAQFALLLGTPSQSAALLVVTPNPMRGQVMALYLFMVMVVGSGFGPFLVGWMDNYVFHNEAMLRWSLVTILVILQPISITVIALGLKPYAEAVRAQKTA